MSSPSRRVFRISAATTTGRRNWVTALHYWQAQFDRFVATHGEAPTLYRDHDGWSVCETGEGGAGRLILADGTNVGAVGRPPLRTDFEDDSVFVAAVTSWRRRVVDDMPLLKYRGGRPPVRVKLEGYDPSIELSVRLDDGIEGADEFDNEIHWAFGDYDAGDVEPVV
jgi:hypothetical protein